MPNEREIMRALVEVADTFVADYDVVDFLHGLAVRCVALLDVDEAGVMLVDPTGGLSYVASSSEQMRLVELLELQHEEGPCLDAYLHGRVTVSSARSRKRSSAGRSSLRTRAAPDWSRSRESRCAFDSTGSASLNLFSRRPGGLSDEDQHVAQAMADVATIGVLQARAIHDGQVIAAQLQTALESRVAIEQAKGIIVGAHGDQRR